jgi:hypothetical protein
VITGSNHGFFQSKTLERLHGDNRRRLQLSSYSMTVRKRRQQRDYQE